MQRIARAVARSPAGAERIGAARRYVLRCRVLWASGRSPWRLAVKIGPVVMRPAWSALGSRAWPGSQVLAAGQPLEQPDSRGRGHDAERKLHPRILPFSPWPPLGPAGHHCSRPATPTTQRPGPQLATVCRNCQRIGRQQLGHRPGAWPGASQRSRKKEPSPPGRRPYPLNLSRSNRHTGMGPLWDLSPYMGHTTWDPSERFH